MLYEKQGSLWLQNLSKIEQRNKLVKIIKRSIVYIKIIKYCYLVNVVKLLFINNLSAQRLNIYFYNIKDDLYEVG